MALFEVTEFEEKVVEPYVKLGNESLEERLAKVQQQTQVILRTNVLLQEKLTEEDLICKELEDRNDELAQHEEVLHSERYELKFLEEEVREQLRAISQGRRYEKIRLQSTQLQLEEKVSALAAERARLLNQDREERETLERQARMIESLEGEVISLGEKKAWLERSEPKSSPEAGKEGCCSDDLSFTQSEATRMIWGNQPRETHERLKASKQRGGPTATVGEDSKASPVSSRPQSPRSLILKKGGAGRPLSPTWTRQKGSKDALPSAAKAGRGLTSSGRPSSPGRLLSRRA